MAQAVRRLDWPDLHRDFHSRDLHREKGVKTGASTFQRSTFNLNCFRCLSPGHFVRDCLSSVRCRSCFNYGHIARACSRRRLGRKQVWQRKLKPQNTDFISSTIETCANAPTVEVDASASECPATEEVTSPQAELAVATRAEQIAAAEVDNIVTMANFAISPEQSNQQPQNLEGWPAWEQAAIVAPAAQERDQDKHSEVFITSVQNSLVQGAGSKQQVQTYQLQQHIAQPLEQDQLPNVQAPHMQGDFQLPDYLPAAYDYQWPDCLPATHELMPEHEALQWPEILPPASATGLQQHNRGHEHEQEQEQHDQQQITAEEDRTSNEAMQIVKMGAAGTEQVTLTDMAPKVQGKGTTSKRDRGKVIVYCRKKFSLFKFAHNRIIEITYQRKNKNKRRKYQGKTPTPITTKGLRRSPRMEEINEGHKPVFTQSNKLAQLQSSSRTEGMQQVCSLATNSVLSAHDMFAGPEKFPTIKDIDESLTPLPAISIHAIQKVAVEECGLSPEEVAKELLLTEKDQVTEQGEEDPAQAVAHS